MRFIIPILLLSCLSASNRSAFIEKKPHELFIVLNEKSYEQYNQIQYEKGESELVAQEFRDNLAIVKTPYQTMSLVSHFFHEVKKQCGGFTSHFSYEGAMKKVDSITEAKSIQSIMLEQDIDQTALVNNIISKASMQRLGNFITELSSFHTRYFRSPTGVQSSEWILKTWQNITKHRSDTEVGLFHHSWSQPSVYAKIKGSSDDLIIIGGHLDSKNYSQTVGHAPGADDDASGIGVMTEVMRSLMDSNYVPEHTLLFVGYAAEEDGLLGSEDFAQYTFNTQANILGVLQVDMALHNTLDSDIYIITDYTNAAQNTFISNLITAYTNAGVQTDTCNYGCSDHASWNHPTDGFLGSLPFEARFGSGSNPDLHTVNDTIDQSGVNLNHGMNFVKLGIAFMVEVDK